MIEKNVVLLETINCNGTGLLYPCLYKKNKGFIIFTNQHVLEDLCNIKTDIYIEIYDDFGHKVPSNKIKIVDYFFPKDTCLLNNDLAAIYVELMEGVVLNVEENVFIDSLENRSEIYTEGYPGVMLEDFVNKRIQLKGISKSLFPENKDIGAYQISDDYHWYNDYTDYKLLSGLSGSPVYTKLEQKKYILGINQSVSNINNGENPFKLVYYIKFIHILNYFRRCGCLIFTQKSRTTFRIRWRKDEQQLKKDNEIKLLLIGGSGAGKSSFARSFLYNYNKIKSVGDGQTTRSDVKYSVTINEEKPNVKVQFFSRTEFSEIMFERVDTTPIRYIFGKTFGIEIELYENEKNLIEMIDDFCDMVYPNGNEQINGIKKSIKKLLYTPQKEESRFAVFESIFNNFERLLYEYPGSFDKENKNESSEMIKKIIEIKNKYGQNRTEWLTYFKEKWLEDLNILKIINVEGFFYVNEFDYLLGENWIEDIKYNYKCKFESEKAMGELSFQDDIKFFFNSIHDKIFGEIKKISYFENNCLCFNLEKMTKKEVDILEKCLQVKNGMSLTGIIKLIEINDSVSNEYAELLYDLKINKATLIDTCGLDHITVWNEYKLRREIKRFYREYVNKWDINNIENIDEIGEIGIVYIKKLDSGKPDELRSILPVVREIIPSVPVYCLFSGIDIFYRNTREIENIYWKKDGTNLPKSVKFLLEEFEDINDEKVSLNLSRVLKNNILAFCGNNNFGKDNSIYVNNNIRSVRRLLNSISMKEYSSLNIIENKLILEIKKPEWQERIKEFIKKMFENASIKNTDYMWNTQQADIKSFFAYNSLGAHNTYDHLFGTLFHIGYVTAIKEKIISNEFVENNQSLLHAFYNAERSFLGINDNLISVDTKNKKNTFRNLIEEMYENQEIDPFNVKDYEDEINKHLNQNKNIESEKRKKIYDEIFNFNKLLNSKLLNNFVCFFTEILVKQIKSDNKIKVNSMIEGNNSFVKSLDIMRKEFLEKNGLTDDENGNSKFRDFMRCYFSDDNNDLET